MGSGEWLDGFHGDGLRAGRGAVLWQRGLPGRCGDPARPGALGLGISASAGAAIVLAAALLAGGHQRRPGSAGELRRGGGGIGLMFFYAGLAAGPMSVVAPLSSLVSIVLPVGVALAAGERPGPLVYSAPRLPGGDRAGQLGGREQGGQPVAERARRACRVSGGQRRTAPPWAGPRHLVRHRVRSCVRHVLCLHP